MEQGFPYQASIRVKDEEGAEDQAEEEVDQVDVGHGAAHVDQHLLDEKGDHYCQYKLIREFPRIDFGDPPSPPPRNGIYWSFSFTANF